VANKTQYRYHEVSVITHSCEEYEKYETTLMLTSREVCQLLHQLMDCPEYVNTVIPSRITAQTDGFEYTKTAHNTESV